MQKFFKDPWNQLALIVFAMSLSYILIKFDYFSSVVKGASSAVEGTAQNQDPKAPAVVAAPSVQQPVAAPPTADIDRQPNSVKEEEVEDDQQATASPPAAQGALNLKHSRTIQTVSATTTAPNQPQVIDPDDTTPANSAAQPNQAPPQIPIPAGISPAIAAAIANVNASLSKQSSRSNSLNAHNANATQLPAPTRTFSMSDVKISGRGYKNSWAYRPNSVAGVKIDMKNTNNEWIVDINKGAGADTDSIKHALSMAQKGDTIKIRSGEYIEEFSMRYDVTIVGEGADKVIIRYKNENLFVENATVYWEGFTFKVENPSGYNSIHATDSTINFKNMNFTNISFNFEKSKIHLEEIKIKDVRTYGAAISLKQSMGSIVKINGQKITGDFIALANDSDLTVSEAEVEGIKNSVISSNKSTIKLNDIKATDVESFAYHFTENKNSSVKKISCTNCRYGLHVSNSKLEVDGVEFNKIKVVAILVNRAELDITNVKINQCENAVSVNNSRLNISYTTISSAQKGLSLFDNKYYKSSEINANNINMKSTQIPWDWSGKIGDGVIRGNNNSPQIQNKQGDYYVRH